MHIILLDLHEVSNYTKTGVIAFLPRTFSIGKAAARVISRNESEAISETDRTTIKPPVL